MEQREYDVIVIGGGPGGSTLSTLMAMEGRRVLQLEKDKFPRHRIGESLLPATVHGICSMLGVTEELKRENFPVKRGACFRWGKSPDIWSFDFGDLGLLNDASAGWAYQVERSKFDQILLNNARKHGVDVREEHSFVDLIVEDGRAVGIHFEDAQGNRHSARARWVADASGATSKLCSWVGERVQSNFFRNVALYGYYTGGKRVPGREGNILCAAFRDGWFWYIPLSDTLTSVGAVVDVRNVDKLKAGPEEAMKGFIEDCPVIKDFLSPAERVQEGQYGSFRVVKDYSYANTAFWKNGVFLIGDAACFVDPVFSTGVHLTTYSALLAARSMLTVLRGDLDEERCAREFELRYRLEFERVYNFMISFYDMEQDLEGYYWAARRINSTEERANDAFISLVAGVSSGEFFGARGQNGELLAAFVNNQGMKNPSEGTKSTVTGERLTAARSAEIEGRPLHPGGLVPTPDGRHWREGMGEPLASNVVEALLRTPIGGPGSVRGTTWRGEIDLDYRPKTE